MDNLSKYVIIEPSILFNESGENFLKKISTPNKAVWQKIWVVIVLATFFVSSVVFVPRLYGDSQENASQVLTAFAMCGDQDDLNGTTVESIGPAAMGCATDENDDTAIRQAVITPQIDNLTENQTISYQTKVVSEGFNPEHSFTNHVEVVGNSGEKPYFADAKDATVNVGSALFGKSGSYDLVPTNTKIPPPTPPAVKTGSMTITKVDGQSGAVLAGAKFALYKAQYPSKAEPSWQLYDQAVTAEATGQAIFADLAYGKYYLQEIAAPTGYELSETTYPFSIDDQHKELSYRWLNTAKTPDEEEEKPDDETPDNNGGSGGGGGGSGGGDDSNNGSSDGSDGGSNNGGGSVLPPSPSETPVPVTPVTPETAVVPEEPSASETPMEPEASNGPVISAEGVVDPSTVDQIIAGITSQDVPTSGKVEVPEGGQADLHYPPSYGTATVELDGSWQYAPEQGFSGRDQFVIKVTNADGEEEFILMDMEVPLAGWLPETGEASRKGIYLVGVLCLLAGCGLLISGKKRQKQSY